MKLAFCPKKETVPVWLSLCYLQPAVPALLQVLTSSWLPVTEGWALTMGGLRLECHIWSQWPPSHYTSPLLLPVTTGKPTEAFPPPISSNLLNEPSGPPVQGSLGFHKRHWDVLPLPVGVSSKANQPCWLTGPSMALHQLAPDESPCGWVIRCICSAYLWQFCIDHVSREIVCIE